jgi:hypothetical protein
MGSGYAIIVEAGPNHSSAAGIYSFGAKRGRMQSADFCTFAAVLAIRRCSVRRLVNPPCLKHGCMSFRPVSGLRR